MCQWADRETFHFADVPMLGWKTIFLLFENSFLTLLRGNFLSSYIVCVFWQFPLLVDGSIIWLWWSVPLRFKCYTFLYYHMNFHPFWGISFSILILFFLIYFYAKISPVSWVYIINIHVTFAHTPKSRANKYNTSSMHILQKNSVA